MKKPILWLLPLLLMACNEPVAHQPTASAASATTASTTSSISVEIPANLRTPASETWEGLLQQATDLRAYIKNTLPHTTPEQADALFEQYFEIMVALQNKFEQGNYDILTNYSDYFTSETEANPELLAKQQQLTELGLEFFPYGGGAAVIYTTPNHYLTLFGKQLSPNYYHLVSIFAKHDNEPETFDGVITIGYDEYGQRLADWEDYLAAAYPNNKWQPYVECDVKDRRAVFLLGLENSPAFQTDGITLTEDAAEAWQNFTKQHPNSPTTAIIQSLQGNMSKKNMAAELEKRQPKAKDTSCQELYILNQTSK